MAYDDHEYIKISLHNITYSYMNIVTNGKNGISLSGAVYDIGLNGKFSKYEPGKIFWLYLDRDVKWTPDL